MTAWDVGMGMVQEKNNASYAWFGKLSFTVLAYPLGLWLHDGRWDPVAGGPVLCLCLWAEEAEGSQLYYQCRQTKKPFNGIVCYQPEESKCTFTYSILKS